MSEKIDSKNVPKSACRVMAYAVLADIEKAFENPEIKAEYQKWLLEYRKKNSA